MLVVTVGFIIEEAGGTGGWVAFYFVGAVLILLYLQYIVRPRLMDLSHSSWWVLAIAVPVVILPWSNSLTPALVILFGSVWLMLTLVMWTILLFRGDQSAHQANASGASKIATIGTGLLAAPIILVGGMLASFSFVETAGICFPEQTAKAWGCSYSGTGAKAAEADAVQYAIDYFMSDNAISEVPPSTSGEGGEKINDTGGQFHATLGLQPYIREFPPTYCYRWLSDGLITFQYDVDDDGNCSSDTDQLFP